LKIDRLEATLTDIWKDLLQIPQIGPDEHFLDLGGDSMLALRLKSRIRERLGVEPTAEMLFNCSTVRELTAALAPLLENADG
jgi:acyl carrier protein